MTQRSLRQPSTSEILVRNRTGDAIHRAFCPHVRKGAVRWRWADENPDEDWKTTAPWLRACKTCDPPSPAGQDEDDTTETA